MGCSNSSQSEHLWVNVTIDDEQKDFINSKLKQNACFNDLEDLNINEVLSYMQRRHFNKSQYIFKKGQESDSLYFILKGQCQVIQFDQRMALLNKGAVTGELGMINNIKRTFSVQCIADNTEILRLSKICFDKIAKEYQHRKTSESYQTLLRSPLFSGIEPDYIRKIELSLKESSYRNFRAGEIIIKKDNTSSLVYIIKSGSVKEDTYDNSVYSDSVKLTKFRCFGEEAVLGEPYSTTIIAAEPTTVIMIDCDEAAMLLAPVIESFIENAKSKSKLLKRLRSSNEMNASYRRGSVSDVSGAVRRGSGTPHSGTLSSHKSFSHGSSSPKLPPTTPKSSQNNGTLNSYKSFSHGSSSPRIPPVTATSPTEPIHSSSPKTLTRKGSRRGSAMMS